MIKLHACRKCGAVFPKSVKKCPKCGSTEFGLFEGLIIVFDPEKSKLAKIMNIKDKGAYAQKVY